MKDLQDFLNSPKSIYTSSIAYEIARDEEFVKNLLLDILEVVWQMQIPKQLQNSEINFVSY
jgi:hypothetical protein